MAEEVAHVLAEAPLEAMWAEAVPVLRAEAMRLGHALAAVPLPVKPLAQVRLPRVQAQAVLCPWV